MRLKASIPAYREISVDLPPDETVERFKTLVCAELGIEPELTKLLSNGKPLTESTPLSKVDVSNETVIVDYLWARHLILWGSQGQSAIRSASVLLAGAGAIGNEVAKNLAMLGVGKLFIVDRDTVEVSNVSRMIFFELSDVGVNKAEALAKNVHAKYPFVETLAFRGDLERIPLKFYLDSDVIVCGLDNVASRIYLSAISRKYSVPLVDGGITGLSARAHVYIPPEDPCPICMYPPNQYSRIVGLRNPCDAPVEQPTVPSFATSISLVSSILSQEAIKIILGLRQYRSSGKWPESTGEPMRSVIFVDLKNNRFTPMELKRGEKCYVCGKDGVARERASRTQLRLGSLTADPERTVRNTVGADGNEDLMVFAENSTGETRLGRAAEDWKRLMVGDYLRTIVIGKGGNAREAVLKVT